jgi:hypothetical protein
MSDSALRIGDDLTAKTAVRTVEDVGATLLG